MLRAARLSGFVLTGISPAWRPWAVLAAGLCLLVVPTLIGLAQGPWSTDDGAHGPIIGLASAWLVWSKRQAFQAEDEYEPHPLLEPACWLGMVVFIVAYAVGRSQQIVALEVVSLLAIIVLGIALTGGVEVVRRLAFPLFFLIFLVPLPGSFVDSLTGPLKQGVSVVVEQLLGAAGYPIARSGVILNIGQYQLLVADACSGLASIFSLSAVGLLYMYVTQPRSFWRNAVLVGSIVPTAVVANIIRVVALVLVTYHLGDEAGQGFVHDFAGMVLFVGALLGIILIDMLTGLVEMIRRRL